MACLFVGLFFVGFAAFVIADGVYRRLILAGSAHANSMRVVSFIASFIVICLMVAIFLSKFRFLR